MFIKFFNVVWQTLKWRKQEKKNSKTWKLLKVVIKISCWVWKILKFFFDEGDPT